jgi:pseudouridine kinase
MPKKTRIICVGGATLDRRYYAAEPVIAGTSNPVIGRRAFGGVARNVAESLARLGADVGLVSILGEDEAGEALLRDLDRLGIDATAMARTTENATAEYVAVIGPDGSLVLGLADMEIFDLLTSADLERASPAFATASMVFADCNLSAVLLADLALRSKNADFELVLDAVSAPKARRLPQSLDGVDLLFLNQAEAETYLDRPAMTPIAAAGALRERGARAVVLTLGAEGAVIADDRGVIHTPAVEANAIDVTGAGDAMIAGALYSLGRGEPLADAVRMGTLLAAITTEHGASVHPELSASFLAKGLTRIAKPAISPALSDETGASPQDLDAQDLEAQRLEAQRLEAQRLEANVKVEGPA